MNNPPILILDVETLGLGDAPVWEVASVFLTSGDGRIAAGHWLVDHDPDDMDPELPQSFRDDYAARYNVVKSFPQKKVIEELSTIPKETMVMGSNPYFDMERLEKMAVDNGLPKPPWHYHPIDLPTMVHGYLLGKGVDPAPPWKSDFLSRIIGVDPASFDRHTALGDCMWCLSMWRVITK